MCAYTYTQTYTHTSVYTHIHTHVKVDCRVKKSSYYHTRSMANRNMHVSQISKGRERMRERE